MKSINLLSKYPLATEEVREWFFEKMKKSLQDESVPEDFKKSVMSEAITDERLAVFIDSQPRALFDVFDENALSINIERTPNRVEEWAWNIMQHGEDHVGCASRKEAETQAIAYAFEVLEEQLSPINLPKLEEN